jgi:hypothetical protein
MLDIFSMRLSDDRHILALRHLDYATVPDYYLSIQRALRLCETAKTPALCLVCSRENHPVIAEGSADYAYPIAHAAAFAVDLAHRRWGM